MREREEEIEDIRMRERDRTEKRHMRYRIVTWIVVRQHVSAREDHSSVFQLFRWVVTHTDVAVLGCVCEREREREK